MGKALLRDFLEYGQVVCLGALNQLSIRSRLIFLRQHENRANVFRASINLPFDWRVYLLASLSRVLSEDLPGVASLNYV